MTMCGLSLAVWSRSGNVWFLAVWSRDDNLWSVLAVWSRAGRQHVVPLFLVLSSQPVFCCPLCGSPSWVPHRTGPSVRFTIRGSPQDRSLCAAHHQGFPTGQCPLCGSPSWVPHRTVPSVRFTIRGSPQDSALCAAHHQGFPTGQCPLCSSPSWVPHTTVTDSSVPATKPLAQPVCLGSSWQLSKRPEKAPHQPTPPPHDTTTGYNLCHLFRTSQQGTTYATFSGHHNRVQLMPPLQDITTGYNLCQLLRTSQQGKTYVTSSGHHNRVKPPLTPHRCACGGAWRCPLACFVAWHRRHCPLVSPPFWDGPGESLHTEK